MIVVKDNHVSQFYSKVCIPSWENRGVDVQLWQASTPLTIDKRLRFAPMTTIKYRSLGISKELTPTERAVWSSHFRMWEHCININQPILVLEHDSFCINIDHLTIQPQAFVTYDKGAMGCYIIRPEFARVLVEDAIKIRIDCGPLGYVKWRSEIHKIPIITAEHPSYKMVSNQVYCPDYGRTVDHYTGTDAKNHMHRFNKFGYLFVDRKGNVDLNRVIEVL
jgi:hypothetical protein